MAMLTRVDGRRVTKHSKEPPPEKDSHRGQREAPPIKLVELQFLKRRLPGEDTNWK